MEHKNKYTVMLAALLHDIHKVMWKIPEENASSQAEFAVRFFEQSLLSNPHAAAIKQEVFEILWGEKDHLLEFISRADSMEKEENSKAAAFRRKPLLSILSLVQTTKEIPKGIYYYKPGQLDTRDINATHCIDEKDFPSDEEMIKFSQDRYNLLLEDIKALPNLQLPQLIDTLLYLFEKHLSTVSSAAYSKQPDISLFDHLKTTTALTSCINEADNDQKPFLIVAADMSGIQNFIYSETNPIENSQKGRSKQFRGKSFYLTLLTDTFSSYLLDLTGMSSANLLINGGGHFVLVVPNSTQNRERVLKAKKKIQKWFFKTYKGELNLILETLEADDSLYKDFSAWYGEIANRLMAAKKQKSIELMTEVFGMNLDSADRQYEVHPEGEDKMEYDALAGYEKFLYSLTEMFSDIGAVLPKAKFMIRKFVPPDFKALYRREYDLVEIAFPEFGITWGIAAGSKKAKEFITDGSSLSSTLYSVNSFETALSVVAEINPQLISFASRLVGNQAPTSSQGAVLEFQEIAKINSQSGEPLEYSALSVLRMDVDNLGSIFSFGLDRENEKESIRSLSRTVNLSRALNLFFTGYINIIAEKWDIYITYSGGDDLFVVGSWINTLNFALDLKKEFTKFACGNKNLTISGGSYLCKDSYPIHKAANHAGEAESKAKKSSDDKDSISLFGKEFRWERAKELVDYGKELDGLVNSEDKHEKITSAYIHFLLGQTTTMLNEDKSLNIDKYFRKMFKIKYSLARSPREVGASAIKEFESGRDNNKKVALLSKLVNDQNSKGLVEDFVVPASYVILKNRKNKQ